MRLSPRLFCLATAGLCLASAGCGTDTPTRPNLALAAEPAPPAPTGPAAPPTPPAPTVGAAFQWKEDAGGTLLRLTLSPVGPPPMTAEANPTQQPRTPLASLDAPRLPLTAFPGTINPVAVAALPTMSPRPLSDGPPLDYLAKATPTPTRSPMPATPAVPSQTLAREVPVNLPVSAKRLADRASLDDPTATFSAGLVIGGASPARTTPAEFLPLSRPDPFENATLHRTPAAPLADDPTVEARTAPRPVQR